MLTLASFPIFMKQFLFGILFFSAAITFTQTDEREIIKETKIISSVSTLYSYTVEGDRHEGGAKLDYKKYDSEGNVIHLIKYNVGKQGINYQWFYKYDKNHNIIEGTKKDANDVIIEKYNAKYNNENKKTEQIGVVNSNPYSLTFTYQNGLLTSKYRIVNSDTVFHYKYHYNEQNLLMTEDYTTSDLAIKTVYSYNEKQLCSKQQTFLDDEIKKVIEFKYDDKNRKTEERTYNQEEKLVSTYTYQYNTSGYISSLVNYDHQLGYEKNKWKYEYDGNGLNTKIYTYDSGDKYPVYVKEFLFKFPKKKN